MIADSFLAAIAGFTIYVLAVAVALRLWHENPPFVSIGMTVPTYAVTLLLAIGLGGKISFWHFSALYSAFVLSFLMAFGAVYKSISLRLLLDLYDAPQHTNAYDDVLDRLVRQDSFEARIEVMKRSGFVRLDNDLLVLEDKGLRMARAIHSIQTLFGIEKSG